MWFSLEVDVVCLNLVHRTIPYSAAIEVAVQLVISLALTPFLDFNKFEGVAPLISCLHMPYYYMRSPW